MQQESLKYQDAVYDKTFSVKHKIENTYMSIAYDKETLNREDLKLVIKNLGIIDEKDIELLNEYLIALRSQLNEVNKSQSKNSIQDKRIEFGIKMMRIRTSSENSNTITPTAPAVDLFKDQTKGRQ
jgi:hypothetical protein